MHFSLQRLLISAALIKLGYGRIVLVDSTTSRGNLKQDSGTIWRGLSHSTRTHFLTKPMKEPVTTLGRPPTTITKTTTTTTTTVPTTSITLTSTDAVPAPISIHMEIMRGADLTVPENVEQSDHLPDLSLIHPVRKKHIGSEIDYPPVLTLLPGNNRRLPFGTDIVIRRRRNFTRETTGRAAGRARFL